MNREELKKDVAAGALLALIGFALLFPGSGSTAVLGQGDELMHIATVRESTASDQWFLPVINGAPNYHKPPLLFWAGMASESLFGASLWAARFPSVLSAVLTVLCVFGILRTFGVSRRYAFWTALLYAGTFGVFKFGRLLMMEQGMTLAAAGMVWAFAVYLRRGSSVALLISGTCAAVAYLFKGPLFQVYGGLMLATWASMLLFRFRATENGVRWAGRTTHIVRVIKAGVLFHVPLLIPIAWAYFAYARSDAGAQLLEYLVVFENVSKFREPNQSEMRIISGWLVHMLPYAILLLAGAVLALRARARSPRAWIGQVLIWTALVWTLLHLLPNRKAMYYMLPALPGLVAGIAMVIDMRAMRRALTVNTALIVVLLAVFAGLALVLYWNNFVFVILAGAILALASFFVLKRRIESSYATAVTAGLLFSMTLQWGVIPFFHRSILPQDVRGRLAQQLCVVSPDTWDALAYRNELPNAAVLPATTVQGCLNDGATRPGIIVFRADAGEPPPQYQEVERWYVWRDDLTLEEIRGGLTTPQSLMRAIRYWEGTDVHR